MIRKLLYILLGLIMLAAMPLAVLAHSGKTDGNGCHTNRKTGDYHCHETLQKQIKTEARITAPSAEPKVARNMVAEDPYVCSRDAYNCSDFVDSAQAQRVFEFCGGRKNDVHRLDADNDGFACEKQ